MVKVKRPVLGEATAVSLGSPLLLLARPAHTRSTITPPLRPTEVQVTVQALPRVQGTWGACTASAGAGAAGARGATSATAPSPTALAPLLQMKRTR